MLKCIRYISYIAGVAWIESWKCISYRCALLRCHLSNDRCLLGVRLETLEMSGAQAVEVRGNAFCKRMLLLSLCFIQLLPSLIEVAEV